MYYSPLRYPGGKGKLASFMKTIIENTGHKGGIYIEPFAGGAGIALDLLLNNTVSEIVINDYDKGIYSFWKAILTETNRFINDVRTAELTVAEWERQHEIYISQQAKYSYELGFATFYLNRTNRSGIIKGGVIGGKEQGGKWTMDVRFTDSNLNHTGIYLYSKGKIMIHLTFDYKTDEKCTTPGQYLKYHRTFQGLSTRELAEKVGIVPATLVLYENDRHPIKYSTAVALANVLGIDRNRLLDEYTAFVDYPYSSLLKMVRQELSLTQMQMAEVIGIGQTSYSGWEREIRVPRRKEYEKILAALKKLKVNVDTYLCHPAST